MLPLAYLPSRQLVFCYLPSWATLQPALIREFVDRQAALFGATPALVTVLVREIPREKLHVAWELIAPEEEL